MTAMLGVDAWVPVGWSLPVAAAAGTDTSMRLPSTWTMGPTHRREILRACLVPAACRTIHDAARPCRTRGWVPSMLVPIRCRRILLGEHSDGSQRHRSQEQRCIPLHTYGLAEHSIARVVVHDDERAAVR